MPTYVSRKAIANTLLGWIAPAGGPFFKTGRRTAKPEQAAAPNQPGLFLIKPNERTTGGAEGAPPERALRFVAVIYTDFTGQDAAVPADVIDDLIDYVTLALASNQAGGAGGPLPGRRQTLGNTFGVYDAQIDGEITYFTGDLTGKGQTFIPIKVPLNAYP